MSHSLEGPQRDTAPINQSFDHSTPLLQKYCPSNLMIYFMAPNNTTRRQSKSRDILYKAEWHGCRRSTLDTYRAAGISSNSSEASLMIFHFIHLTRYSFSWTSSISQVICQLLDEGPSYSFVLVTSTSLYLFPQSDAPLMNTIESIRQVNVPQSQSCIHKSPIQFSTSRCMYPIV